LDVDRSGPPYVPFSSRLSRRLDWDAVMRAATAAAVAVVAPVLVAARLEDAAPWRDRIPPLSVTRSSPAARGSREVAPTPPGP
jgi:hypothetical protein